MLRRSGLGTRENGSERIFEGGLLRWAEEYDVRLDRLAARTASLESVFLAIADERDDPSEPTSLTLEGRER